MRTCHLPLLLTAPLSVRFAAALGTIHSHLLIDAGKQFMLGGDQAGAFRTQARNTGPGPVLVLERLPNGTVLERGRLEPGKDAQLDFQAGSAVLVRNLGDKRAELDVDITRAQTPVAWTTSPRPSNNRYRPVTFGRCGR